MSKLGRLIDSVQVGDSVTIVNRFGQERTGKAVMRSAHGGWVLNMGGPHGTPGLADDDNVTQVKKRVETMSATLYARREITSDPEMVGKKFDTVIYRDSECTMPVSRYPWHYQQPRLSQKTIIHNCGKYKLEWR